MTRQAVVHGSRSFWDVAEVMRDIQAPWICTAGYELRCHLDLAGRAWTICLKLHVLGEPGAGKQQRPGVRFESSVTLWPPMLTKSEERDLANLGWYDSVERVLGKRRYRGDWRRAKGVGLWANFEKRIASIAGVRSEADWQRNFRSATLMPHP